MTGMRFFCWSVLMWFCATPSVACELQVSAATSLRSSIKQVADAFNVIQPGCKVYLNIAGSHALARQIIAGAKVDIFIPASVSVLAKAGRTPLKQKTLLRNELVIIGQVQVKNIAQLLSKSRTLAIGQPSLPAGYYAHLYLKQRKWLTKVRSKLVFADNVRGVMTMVEKKAADAGFVYRTELAQSEVAPEVVFSIPEVTVVYPGALYSSSPQAEAFYRFLSGKQAKSIFESHGFRFDIPHG